MKYARIDGSLTTEKRRAVIAEFQKLPDLRIMLLSYGSGSVGYVPPFAKRELLTNFVV
jgi:SNF2 family DNA or RNA helicase